MTQFQFSIWRLEQLIWLSYSQQEVSAIFNNNAMFISSSIQFRFYSILMHRNFQVIRARVKRHSNFQVIRAKDALHSNFQVIRARVKNLKMKNGGSYGCFQYWLFRGYQEIIADTNYHHRSPIDLSKSDFKFNFSIFIYTNLILLFFVNFVFKENFISTNTTYWVGV